MEHKSTTPAPETSEATLLIGHYNDIFSSFYIRPYSKRALSVDFLDELKRAVRDTSEEKVELVFLVPGKHRDEYHETVIKERLAAHFKIHYNILLNEKYRIRKTGIGMVVMGIACMVAATFMLSENSARGFFHSFLVVLLEPAAWFLLWEGMDQIIFNSKSINPELNFYHKMSTAHERVYFKSY